MSQRILCVDDDPNVLRGFARSLRNRYALETSTDPQEALKVIEANGPYAVIVSDMRMPGIDGVQLLTRVREIAPDTVRMMLTGNADQQTAAAAVNEGSIFRFLTKPCSPEDLASAIDAGLERYRAIRAERELLSKTLNGSVGLLTEVLSMVNPLAFGRAESVRCLVHGLCQCLTPENAWEIELAAMLSQVGCIAVPQEILQRVAAGEPLDEPEQRVFDEHPRIGASLIVKIPRLEQVARIVAHQSPPSADNGDVSPLTPAGASVLQLALETDRLLAEGATPQAILSALRKEPRRYNERLVTALSQVLGVEYTIRQLTVDELEDGMVFDEHVQTTNGSLLVAQGRVVVPLVRERLVAHAHTVEGIRQPIRMRCRH